MTSRTDKQAALDDHAEWILKKLEKRYGDHRLGLNTQEIGQVLDSMMGPAYDDNGTPTPQRQDPAEAARRMIASGVIHDGRHGKIQVGQGGRTLSVPLPALAASLASIMLDPKGTEGDWVMGQASEPAPAARVITQTRGPKRLNLGFMIASPETTVPADVRPFHWAPMPARVFDPTPEEHQLLEGVMESLDKINESHFEERAALRRDALQRSIDSASRPDDSILSS